MVCFWDLAEAEREWGWVGGGGGMQNEKRKKMKRTLTKVQLYDTAWALAVFQLTNSRCIESHADALYVFFLCATFLVAVCIFS